MVSPYRAFFFTGIALLAAATVALHFLARWPWTWSYLAAASFTTALLYGHDKLAARAKWLRIPEVCLHTFALVGGSPGALIAQRLFRHKTSKRSFQIVFWIVATAQIVLLLAFLFMPSIRERF